MPVDNRASLQGTDDLNRGALSPNLEFQLSELGRNWGWFLAAGICFVVLGVAAILWPVASTVGLTFTLGVLFIVGAFIRGVQAIRLRREIGTGWRVFDAFLSLAVGFLLLRYPASGILGIAIAMAFYFFMGAVIKFVLAMATRPLPGSGWAFISAIASFALGVLMIASFPVSALWIPGMILGIEFTLYGISLIGSSFSLKKFHREHDLRVERGALPRRAA